MYLFQGWFTGGREQEDLEIRGGGPLEGAVSFAGGAICFYPPLKLAWDFRNGAELFSPAFIKKTSQVVFALYAWGGLCHTAIKGVV
jgi:hypothetical protein